ncbi:unnamed protein product [Lactuca virosa]|uniref:Uncharacterized protein n=1 Tax=Lactuca virosa TaxID=75947 RepID=A0AAU9MZN3_9ASTR|nr:unnamed protein product [Lactuca virosa]
MTYVYHFYISWCLLVRPNRRGEMSVAVTYMSSSGDLNTRRQERRINILSASNRSSKSRPGLSSADLLHASVDGSAKMAEIIGSQYNIVQDMFAIFGKHYIVNFFYLYDFSRISDTDSWISQIQVWVLLKCVKLFFSEA